MTQLDGYLGTRVHLHLHPLGICETGVLGVEGQWLTIRGIRIPTAGMRVHAAPFGPVELPGQADVSLADDERLIQIWRDRPQADWQRCG